MKEKEYLDAVAQLPCLACERDGYINPLVLLHHIRHGQGMGQRAHWSLVIPLCQRHHQTGGFGVAFHAGPRTWQAKYGREADLVGLVRKRLIEAGFLDVDSLPHPNGVKT